MYSLFTLKRTFEFRDIIIKPKFFLFLDYINLNIYIISILLVILEVLFLNPYRVWLFHFIESNPTVFVLCLIYLTPILLIYIYQKNKYFQNRLEIRKIFLLKSRLNIIFYSFHIIKYSREKNLYLKFIMFLFLIRLILLFLFYLDLDIINIDNINEFLNSYWLWMEGGDYSGGSLENSSSSFNNFGGPGGPGGPEHSEIYATLSTALDTGRTRVEELFERLTGHKDEDFKLHEYNHYVKKLDNWGHHYNFIHKSKKYWEPEGTWHYYWDFPLNEGEWDKYGNVRKNNELYSVCNIPTNMNKRPINPLSFINGSSNLKFNTVYTNGKAEIAGQIDKYGNKMGYDGILRNVIGEPIEESVPFNKSFSIPKKLEPENIIFSQAPGQDDYWGNTRDLDGFLINKITGTKVK